MEPMKNLCGLIPESLHKRLMEAERTARQC